MSKSTFAREFFKLYDRKIANGEITFSQIGMDKSDFNRICTDTTFVPARDKLEAICQRMKLTEEESARLLAYAGKA